MSFSPFLVWYPCDLWIAASASVIDAFENPVLMVEIRVRGEGEIERQGGEYLSCTHPWRRSEAVVPGPYTIGRSGNSLVLTSGVPTPKLAIRIRLTNRMAHRSMSRGLANAVGANEYR